MNETKLSELEVKMIETVRKLDEHGQFKAIMLLGQMEEHERMMKRLEELESAVSILKEFFKKHDPWTDAANKKG